MKKGCIQYFVGKQSLHFESVSKLLMLKEYLSEYSEGLNFMACQAKNNLMSLHIYNLPVL